MRPKAAGTAQGRRTCRPPAARLGPAALIGAPERRSGWRTEPGAVLVAEGKEPRSQVAPLPGEDATLPSGTRLRLATGVNLFGALGDTASYPACSRSRAARSPTTRPSPA